MYTTVAHNITRVFTGDSELSHSKNNTNILTVLHFNSINAFKYFIARKRHNTTNVKFLRSHVNEHVRWRHLIKFKALF